MNWFLRILCNYLNSDIITEDSGQGSRNETFCWWGILKHLWLWLFSGIELRFSQWSYANINFDHICLYSVTNCPRDCLHLRTTPIKCESWYNTYFHFWFLKLDIIFPSPHASHSFIYSFIQPICHFHQTKTNVPIHSWIVGTQPAQSSSHHRRHLSTSKSSPVQQSCGSETGGLWGFRLDPVVHSFARSFERSSFAAPR